MVNFVEFVLILVLAIVFAIFVFLLTGVIYTKDNYVSIIEKNRKFHKIENRKFTFYFPIIYRRVYTYPFKEGVCKLKNKTVYYEIKDIMFLYQNKVNINKLIKNSKNLEEDFEKLSIKLIRIDY